MGFDTSKHMAVGTRVKVANPMDVPDYSTWDDDKGRTSASVKKRLQGQFFRGDSKIVGEVLYISKESERERLRRNGLVKVRIRNLAGSMLTLTADPAKLKPCH